MAYVTINWVLSALGLLGIAIFVPGFRISDYGSALIAAGSVGLIAAMLGTALKRITRPVGLLAATPLLLLADLIVFRVSGLLIPGFAMRGFVPALAGAAALVAISLIALRWARRIQAEFDWEPSPDVEIESHLVSSHR